MPRCPLVRQCRFCTPELSGALPNGAIAHTRVTAGADVFAPGDRWHAVLSVRHGVGAIYRLLPTGQRRIVEFALPGEVIGLAFGTGPISVGLQALEEFSFCALSREQFDALAERRPGAALALWRLAGEVPGLALDRFAHMGQQQAEARIARLLLELCIRRTGAWPIAAGAVVALPITQEHIADAVGLSTGHVCRTLAAFPRRGILSYRWQKLVVGDPAALLDVASIDADMLAQWAGRRRPAYAAPFGVAG